MITEEPGRSTSEEEVFVFPASFAQQRLCFLDQLVSDTSFYNVPAVIRLVGTLNLNALRQSFNEIVRRHEILRTTFVMVEGQTVQAIAPRLSVFLPVIDLQTFPVKERDAEAKRLLREEMQRPFKLSQGPLIRLMLLQLGEAEYLLLMNLHHIVFDEWSSGVLIQELGTFYTALSAGQPSQEPELPIQYADFAHWQREWLQGEILESQLSYWRQQLKDVTVLNLPSDRPRPTVQSYRGTIQQVELPQSLTQALEVLGQQVGATLFMTLLAAFQTLLYRYTEQTDIAIGSPIANRNRSELEGLIGFFVNSLVLRGDLSGNPTFRELLERVREMTLAAYAHQDLPFEKLVLELHPTRDLSRNPLFQVVFAVQNTPMAQLELPGLTLSSFEFDIRTTRFDLEFYLWECSENFRSLWGEGWQNSAGLRGAIVYNTDLFEQATIARLLRSFQTLLEGIVANPDERLADLPILTELQQQQLLVNWNDTQTDYPSNQCIHQLFEAQVERCPSAIAVRFGNKQFTYRELNSGSNQLAHYLQKLGVGVETLVGVCLDRSSEMVAALLGILKAGGTYVPLDPTYPSERLRFMLEDAQVSVLLTRQQSVEQFGECKAKIVCLDRDWEAIAQESEDNPTTHAIADNLAYVIYTSGSTGKPKGVAVKHRAVNRLVCNTNYIQLKSADKIAQVSNISFDAATFEIWGALLNGAQLVGINREISLSPKDFVAELQQQQISVLFLSTALFNQIASVVPSAFSNLRYLLFGGEVAAPQQVQAVLRSGSPQHLLHVYGPTESTTFACWYEVQNSEQATSVPIGHPVANTQLYILDSQLKPVPIGVRGELYIGGDGLARGYLNRPELTAERFISNPFSAEPEACLYRTGDLARYRVDGEIEFLGRVDEQVKLRGFRIELGEIEMVLNQHPEVRLAIAQLQQDSAGDKRLVAYVVPTQKPAPPLRELRSFLKSKLPEYMVPSAFVILDALPLTPNGKVDRRALPVVNMERIDLAVPYQAPQTDIEQRLATIWTRLLGLEQVGIHDNFFELGGHSLLATQLMSRVRDAFHVEVPLRNLFEAPTLASLAKHIETLSWATQGFQVSDSPVVGREEMEI